MSDGFYEQLREVLVYARRGGRTLKLVRLSPQRRKLIEAEFGVQHANGEMRLEGVLLVADAAVDFDEYRLE